MSLNLWVQAGTLLSIAFGVVAFFWGVKSYNRQMNAQVFIEYSKRFDVIMQSFPPSAWAARLKSDEAVPEGSHEIRSNALRYLNLCSEEYFLCKSGDLSKHIWGIWEAELKRTLRTPLFRREWQELFSEFQA
jgi:hypothetical protein